VRRVDDCACIRETFGVGRRDGLTMSETVCTRGFNGMRELSGRRLQVFLAGFVLCGCCASLAAAQMSSAVSERKPVVVELFTSEGCSSCPPADTLLQRLAEQQPLPGADIIALEEHVDYWNHDGWNDPYSSAEWTQRQLKYAALFKTEAYTPQMVVDGENQLVGSSTRDASFAIQKAANSPKTDVAISTGTQNTNGPQHFIVSVGRLAGEASEDVAEVWMAVTEDGLRSSVNRGENAGHVLLHVATLRSLSKIGVAPAGGNALSFTGEPRVKFDSHWNREKLSVVIFVQEKKSGKILGAASTRITPRTGNPAVAATSYPQAQ
jgi:hypothetical protein